MEATVDRLEAMFQKAESDLDYISRKLDVEFVSQGEGDGKVNAAHMLQRIGQVKQEYAGIVKEAEAIKEAQKTAMEYFQSQMMKACSAVHNLQLQAGMQAEKPEELTKVEEMLGITNDATDCTAPPGDSPTLTCPASAESISAPLPTEKVVRKQEVPQLSTHDKRAQSDDFMELTEEEFKSVSSLIKGRLKLTDLNHTYRILWHHFKEEGNSKELSPAEMFKMGLRVTGQTGEAKLKVLRALKLLQISKAGHVKLL